MYCSVCNKYRKSKKREFRIFSIKKHQIFLLFAVAVVMNMKKFLKKKNQVKYWKFLVRLII